MRPLFKKPSLQSPLTLAWLTALWIGLLSNWPLWQLMHGLPELANGRGLVFIGVFAGVVVALTGALLSLFAWRPVLKPAMTVLLLLAAAIAYFMGSYGTVIDPTMVVNVLQTDTREARDLLSLRMGASLLILGVLPAVWLWRRTLERVYFPRRLVINLLAFVAGIVAAVLLILAVSADFASTMRNHKQVRYLINPLNALYSIGAVAVRSQQQPSGPPEAIGLDAKLADRPAGAKPPLMVLVVGETARAVNFSLNGYARPTNPELAKLEVLNFANAKSCGTSTAASLPCMFSVLGKQDYEALKKPQEGLLDVLQRAGLAVVWVDNQSGCKGACDRVPHVDLCTSDECMDEALVKALPEQFAKLDPERAKRGVVIVLHQMGSHGPAYYKRSPAEIKPFTPECQSNALQQCPREQVVNGYDNSIAYTDHVLAGVIGWLGQQTAQYNPAMLYMSDHGESLGENGLYLHGVPYAFAPTEQTHIPALMWLPAEQKPQRACLANHLQQPISHDYISHTVMGYMGVKTSVYKPEWDLLTGC